MPEDGLSSSNYAIYTGLAHRSLFIILRSLHLGGFHGSFATRCKTPVIKVLRERFPRSVNYPRLPVLWNKLGPVHVQPLQWNKTTLDESTERQSAHDKDITFCTLIEMKQKTFVLTAYALVVPIWTICDTCKPQKSGQNRYSKINRQYMWHVKPIRWMFFYKY